MLREEAEKELAGEGTRNTTRGRRRAPFGGCAQTARAFTWGARAKHPLRLVGATKNEIPDRGS